MHENIKGVVLTCHDDADQIYPGRKEELHYIGEFSIHAATLDSQKEAAPD